MQSVCVAGVHPCRQGACREREGTCAMHCHQYYYECLFAACCLAWHVGHTLLQPNQLV